MDGNALTLTQLDAGLRFYHQDDERAFFEWLARIPCVENVRGEGRRGLVVCLRRKPGQHDLRQLLALFFRWGVDMRQLARLENDENRTWFTNPDAFWHEAVFGSSSDKKSLRPPEL